jgi:hypothetical protein
LFFDFVLVRTVITFLLAALFGNWTNKRSKWPSFLVQGARPGKDKKQKAKALSGFLVLFRSLFPALAGPAKDGVLSGLQK